MPRLRCVSLNSVRIGATPWLWPGMVPAGCLVALDGDPGCGKSMITVDLAARLSRGATFPDGAPLDRPMRTLMLNAEDDFENTVLPRLRAAGADLDAIFTMASTTRTVGGRALRLPNDMTELSRLVRTEQIDLIVIDPLIAFIDPKVSINSDQLIRSTLQPLADLNRKTGSTTLLVRHLNKTSVQKSLYRGAGSIGVIAAVRSALMATRHPHREGCGVLTATKMNLGAAPATLVFRIETVTPPTIAWLGPDGATGDANLPSAACPTPGLFRAMGWLQRMLRGGPRLASEIILEATAAGISERTLERAKKEIRVKSRFQFIAGERAWIWIAPDYNDPHQRESEAMFEPLPEVEEADLDVQAKLSSAGREILAREKLQWADAALRQRNPV